MGWSRVADATKVLTPGQDVEVKVLRLDPETQKIALGLKQLAPDPWESVSSKYEVGQVKFGRVTRHAEFGAFIEFEPGIEGLAHVSTFPPTGSPRAWTRAVPIGKVAAFEILTIDADKRRIGVSLVPEGTARATPREDASETNEPQSHTEPSPSFGSMADKLRDAFKDR
jgi:ribosomal protein S1